jgi:hypothetical protein
LFLFAGAPAANGQTKWEPGCGYLSDEGTLVITKSRADIPPKFRSKIVCPIKDNEPIPKAGEIKLGPGAKSAAFVTDIGPVEVRWHKREERCFGKSPARAVADAAKAVNKAIKQARFPMDVKTARRKWSLVFVDKERAMKTFPARIVSGNHPGFMVPPDQIYLITDYIAPACGEEGGAEIADAELTRILLHEMGHAIEFVILEENGKHFYGNRERAEGFASWFEIYSSSFSGVIPEGSAQAMYQRAARSSQGGEFDGTLAGYGKAAMKFDAIVRVKGISGLMAIYATMRQENVDFATAMERTIRWSPKALDREARDLPQQSGDD